MGTTTFSGPVVSLAGFIDRGAQYVGPVASRSALPNTLLSVDTSSNLMTRSVHIAVEKMTDIKVVFSTVYGGSDAEDAIDSGTLTVRASVEYNSEIFQLLFSGTAQAIANNPATIESDLQTLPFTIEKGTRFFIRSWVVITSTTNNYPVYADGLNWPQGVSGEACTRSASAVTDQTMSGTIANNAFQGIHFRPAVILGTTTKPTLFVMGDSLNRGQGGTNTNPNRNFLGFNGILSRMFGPSTGIVNVASYGDSYATASQASSFLLRSYFAKWCTHVADCYGTNDLGLSNTVTTATFAAYIALMKAKTNVTGKPYIKMTLPPRNLNASAASDATRVDFCDGARTVITSNASRLVHNIACRYGEFNIDNYVETCVGYESNLDSGEISYGPRTRTVTDGAMTSGSNLLTSATAAFIPADTGLSVVITGAGTAGAQLLGELQYVSATTCNVMLRNSTTANNAGTTVASTATVYIGYMDYTIDALHPSALGEDLIVTSNRNASVRQMLSPA